MNFLSVLLLKTDQIWIIIRISQKGYTDVYCRVWMSAVKRIVLERLIAEALNLPKACAVYKLHGGIQQLL